MMVKRVFSLDLFPFLVLTVLFAQLCHLQLATAAEDHPNKYGAYGGYSPLQNINDPHVTEIAKFAVSEINKQSQKNLVYHSMVRGESQLVAGTNYRLVIAAKDGDSIKNYECVVWEKVWIKFMKLTSFHEV